MKQKLNFEQITLLAAEFEQGCQYEKAATLWQQAYTHAKKEVNSLWCQHRAQFCRRMAICPF